MKQLPLTAQASMPARGLGTWKSPRGDVARAVTEALRLGYRHIDCAPIYMNEAEVGRSLKEAFAGGLDRKSLWLTSKLWNDAHAPENVRPALEKTLTDLGVDSLDLYLIHWPIVFQPGVLFAGKAEQYLTLEQIPIIETWRAMEECVAAGLVRHIGVCNFSLNKLEALRQQATIKPAMNQVELHPYLQQTAMLEYCRQHAILLTAYSPLGSGDRPAAL